jgi:hypothetical protein
MKITAEITNIPREDGGWRLGNWITGENTTVRGSKKFNFSGTAANQWPAVTVSHWQNPKSQAPNPKEPPNSNTQKDEAPFGYLELGVSGF